VTFTLENQQEGEKLAFAGGVYEPRVDPKTLTTYGRYSPISSLVYAVKRITCEPRHLSRLVISTDELPLKKQISIN